MHEGRRDSDRLSISWGRGLICVAAKSGAVMGMGHGDWSVIRMYDTLRAC